MPDETGSPSTHTEAVAVLDDPEWLQAAQTARGQVGLQSQSGAQEGSMTRSPRSSASISARSSAES